EAVSKLIGQLNSGDFRKREQASDQLEKLGSPVLPMLREAAAGKTEVEVKRRIEYVIGRIENALLKAEEKHWQDLDAPRRGIKERLDIILAKNPALRDEQVASAIYFLTLGRTPTDAEAKQALKELAATDGRRVGTLRLTRSLIQAKEFNVELAKANGQ